MDGAEAAADTGSVLSMPRPLLVTAGCRDGVRADAADRWVVKGEWDLPNISRIRSRFFKGRGGKLMSVLA